MCPGRAANGRLASGQVAMSHTDISSGLLSSVLVLNRFYSAVHIVNVRRAFGLLCRQLAEVLDVEDGQYANYDFTTWLEISEMRAEEKQPRDDWIRSVSFEVQIPRVIRLLPTIVCRNTRSRFNRRNVFARDGHQCRIAVTPLRRIN